MKASELRIGNYINNEQTTDVICEINEDTNTCRCYWLKGKNREVWTVDLDSIKPIPLTEDILLRLGFKYQDRDISHGKGKIERFFMKHWSSGGDQWWLEINLHPITKDSTGFYWLNWNIGGGNNFVHLPHSCKLEYVHQLQNLYWCLCGEELILQ